MAAASGCDRFVSFLGGGSVGLLALLYTTTLAAAPVEVRYREGAVRGFLAVRTPQGPIIGRGELQQRARGDDIDARLLLHFRDGSVQDEATTYSQRHVFRLESYRLTQRGPSFPGAEISFDRRSGRYEARTREQFGGPNRRRRARSTCPPISSMAWRWCC